MAAMRDAMEEEENDEDDDEDSPLVVDVVVDDVGAVGVGAVCGVT